MLYFSLKMLFKESVIHTNDRAGSGLLLILHTYRRLVRRYAKTGEFVKVTIKDLERLPRKIRGKRYRPLRPGFILRSLISMSSRKTVLCNTVTTNTFVNAGVILKRRGTLRSIHILGPSVRPFNTRRLLYIFPTTL